MQFWDEPKRKPIKMSVKREVYKRAKGRCEKCRSIKLDPPDIKGGFKGHYHHTRSPSISPTAKTLQLLCPTCHEKYGHKRKTVRHYGLFENSAETKIKRLRVGIKARKPKTKRVAIRDEWTGEVIGYRTIKVKSKAKKKTTRKPTRKTTTRKKTKTTKKKTTKKRPTKKKASTKRKTTPKKKTRKSRATKRRK